MECDDDPHSILSLPQHSLLQSENGMFASLLSSSSLSNKNALVLKSWPQASYTQGNMSSTSTSTSMSNSNSVPFTTTLPSSSFNQSYIITHPGLSSSSSSSKYYTQSSIPNLAPEPVTYNSIYISEGGGVTRSSNAASTSADFELNTTLLSTNSNISDGDNGNNDNNKKDNNDNNNDGGGISQYYQTSYRNGSSNSINQYGTRLLDINTGISSGAGGFLHNNRGSHQSVTGETTSPGILSLTNHQHSSNSDINGSDDKLTRSPSSCRSQVHPSTGEGMEFSQSVFDARSKHMTPPKGQADLYYGGSSTKITTASLGHDVAASAEKRQDMNLMTEFDFASLSSRDFGPVISNSSRMDYTLHNRSVDEEFRLNQDQSSDFFNQDISHHKYFAQFPQSQSCNTTATPRKASSMHSDFSSNHNTDQNIYSTSSKAINDHSASTYVHKDQISALMSSDGHKLPRDYKKVHFQIEDAQQQTVIESNGSSAEETWSGRSRAHRKMARLLGQASSNIEKIEKSQDHSTSSSSPYQAFPKKSQHFTGYGGTFQDMTKSQEDLKKYPLLETNSRDLPTTSSSHTVKNMDRLGNSCDKSVTYDRRDEDANRNTAITSVRDYNNFATPGNSNSSVSLVQREAPSSLVPSSTPHLFPTNTPGFDLEFQPSVAQRELDSLNPQFALQVSKDLGMEESITGSVNVNPELFPHQVDPHQMAPTNFPFSDNLSSQCPQDILLDSYLNPTEKDGSGFNKKVSYYNQRNIASEAVFNIEEYMDKDFTQACFDQTDNVPQDMTMYQKSSPEKPTNSSYTRLKDKEVMNSPNFKAGTTKQNESGNICELQKELTKTSGKESMKGVRIPRDINRAMEILHLQETEKEEEKRRKRELDKQLSNETPNVQHAHQAQQQQPPQQQHQKFQQSATTINSSPKKTFQNKHQIESMAALTEQLLPMPSNFIEDHSADNVNFLDQSSYCFPDQTSSTSAGICDPNITEISQYSSFPSLYQAGTVDLDATALSNKQRDYQQQNANYPLSQELDYHILKRLAFSTANAKDLDTISMSSSLQQTSSTNIISWSANPSIQQTDAPDLTNFNLGIPRLPEPLCLLNEVHVPPSSSKFPPNSSISNVEDIRGQIQSQCDNLNYPDINSDQRVVCLDPDKFQNFSSFGDGGTSLPSMDITLDKSTALDILETSRETLYNMMKHEQLCDVVLSTSNFEVKVHQIILCSMSQYLSNLLLPPIQPSTESKSNASSTALPQSTKSKDVGYSSNTNSNGHAHDRHHLVLLIINCDNIKSSSISAFLMFIYLGKTEFNESNVLDLFILASSLHVLALKNLCIQFMFQARISDDGLNIPSVQISKKDLVETRDQACFVNIENKKQTEDKAVLASRATENTDVSSQTDQTTCKVGKGGHDEWVMLKKTKQKTVSPSKSKMNLSVKGIISQENNQPAFKPGKKSWLSPKRRFKSELLAQAKYDQNNLTKIKEKEATGLSEPQKDNGTNREDMKELALDSDKFVHPDRNFPATKRPQMINQLERRDEEVQEQATSICKNLRHIKTTVEIAEEAAAAKLSASNININRSLKKATDSLMTPSAGFGHDLCSESAVLDSLLNQSHDEYFQPEMNSALGKARQNNSCKRDTDSCKQASLDMKVSQSASFLTCISEKPMKKKIIQQAFNKSSCDVDTIVSELPNNTSPKKLEFYNNKSHSYETNSIPTVAMNSKGITDNPNLPCGGDGDLNQVSCFFDSFVNEMGSDAELQKAIHDLDSELNQPQMSVHSVVPSSNVVIQAPCSFSSPLLSTTGVIDSTSVSLSFSPYVHKTATTVTTASIPSSLTASSSSLSASPISKSTAQGFRKRLIQLVKSENLKLSSSLTSLSQASPLSDKKEVGNQRLSKGELQDGIESIVTDLEDAPIPNKNKRCEEFGEVQVPSLQNQTDHKKGTEDEANNSASDKGGKGGTAAEDYDTQFHHKIFKRKRKSKTRKMTSNEADNPTSCPKLKTKKATLVLEGEGSNVAKTRVRKSASSTGDIETSATAASRSKSKKPQTVESSEGGSVIRNVRPPPKKRAKMELELLKVTSDDAGLKDTGKAVVLDQSTICAVESDGNKGVEPAVSINSVNKEKQPVDSNAREEIMDTESLLVVNGIGKSETSALLLNKNGHKRGKVQGIVKQKLLINNARKRKCRSSSSTDETKDKKLHNPEAVKNHVTSATVGTGSIPSTTDTSKTTPEKTTSLPCSERGNSFESQWAKELQKQFKQSGLTTRIFSCKLCKLHVKSALVSVKHAMTVHKFQGKEDILQNIMIGFAENKHEACDICGYVTKDVTYKYMHYHKYFKHNVLLPPGLTTQKCHLCSREFQTCYQLNEHVKGHDGDFGFTCWVCGQGFKSRNSMNNHVFHKHSKQRKHCCKICDKAFKTWTHLKVHVRIHTGDRPFTCTECGYGSTTLGNMRHHLAHKHKMGKETMEEAMAKISERKAEMTPKQLDHLMDMIVSKEMPDQAEKAVDKQKGKKKPRGGTVPRSNNDKSSGEENKSDSVKEALGVKLTFKSKSALKETIQGNNIKTPISTLNAVTLNLNSGTNSLGKLILPKVEQSNNEMCSSSLIHQQCQQKSFTIISQPIMANNIVIVPSNPTRKQNTSVIQNMSNVVINKQGLIADLPSSSDDSHSSLASAPVSVAPPQGSKLSPSIRHQKMGTGPHAASSTGKNEITSSVENSTNDNSMIITQQCASGLVAAGESSDILISSLHTALPAVGGAEGLSTSTQPQHEHQVSSTNIIIVPPSTQPSSDIDINNSQLGLTGTASLPFSSLSLPSASSSSIVTVLPSSQPLQQPSQCNGSNGSNSDSSIANAPATSVAASNFIYTAGAPIVLQNPIAGGGTTTAISGDVGSACSGTTMLQGLLPSFIMYPCQPNSNGQHPLMQIQNVSGLMQIVPVATSSQSTVPSYVDIPLFHGPLNQPAITNTQLDLTMPQDNG